MSGRPATRSRCRHHVQPEWAASVLAPYVLSSDVAFEDRTGLVEVVVSFGDSAAEDGADTLRLEPSVLGWGRTVVGGG